MSLAVVHESTVEQGESAQLVAVDADEPVSAVHTDAAEPDAVHQ